ncbi:hypothetical protein F5Y08DRAFT_128043 [Xylaria arbuscula]|nr:hypothetical protein F5Y08DRAFT_128043 [Xylaria arbuscula]
MQKCSLPYLLGTFITFSSFSGFPACSLPLYPDLRGHDHVLGGVWGFKKYIGADRLSEHRIVFFFFLINIIDLIQLIRTKMSIPY